MRNKFCFLPSVIVFALALAACGVKVSPNAISAKIEEQKNLLGIVGGQRAQENDEISKHVVLITIEQPLADNNVKVQVGTGVIISNRFIVTAAHVFENMKIKSGPQDSGRTAYLNFGLARKAGSRQEFFARDFINKSAVDLSDPNYLDRPGASDYVFIRIPNGLPPGYSKMAVMTDKNDLEHGKRIKTAGYGETNNGVSMMPVGRIVNSFGLNYFLESITVGSHRTGDGDSGGPVYYESQEGGRSHLVLAGIHSSAQFFDSYSTCSSHDSDSCKVANYNLRADAFLDEAIRIAKSLSQQ
jgi:V8-like Glu-specific endopeptidase